MWLPLLRASRVQVKAGRAGQGRMAFSILQPSEATECGLLLFNSPQVVEFARMKPVDLLEATEKVGAAGPGWLPPGCAAAIVQQVQQRSIGPPLPCAHKRSCPQRCKHVCARLPACLTIQRASQCKQRPTCRLLPPPTGHRQWRAV